MCFPIIRHITESVLVLIDIIAHRVGVVGMALGIGGYSRHLAASASFYREGEPLRRLFHRPCMLLAAGEVAPRRSKML